MERTVADPIQRFLKFVHITDGCWLWTGCTSKDYGNFWYLGRTCYAHRVSYELFVRAIPDDLQVCHSCDNPLCVRPSHLWTGTNLDNVLDRVTKGRSGHGGGDHSGLHNGRSVLTAEQAVAIYCDPRLQYVIAADYGISNQQVSNIKRGDHWALRKAA